MRSNMDGQRAPLDKALIACVNMRALEWPLVGMYAKMALQIGFAIEALVCGTC